MVDATTVVVVRAYLTALEHAGLDVSCAVVFGSHAAGGASEWSDIDVVVVSPAFDAPRDHGAAAFLWRVAARVDSRIEPFACGAQQWQDDDTSAIIEIARRHGQRVELRPAA